MRKRILLFLAIFISIGSLGLFVFRKRSGSAHAEDSSAVLPAASVAPITKGSLASVLRVAGQFIPYQEVDLHAKVSGYIRTINVDIGDRVHIGQVIARLEVPELNAQLAGTKAEERHSQSEINRSKSEVARAQANHVAIHAAYSRLLEASKQRPGLIAQQELDDAQAKDQNTEAQIEAAKAALEATEQQLGVSQADTLRVQTLSDYSIVVSPFNGVITKRYADTGALIQAGTASNTQAMPVVRVAQSDLLRLRMPVPEADVRYIEPGASVQVTIQAVGRTFTGKITRFTRSLDVGTRTMLVEVDVKNPDLSLSPGMYADTEIVLQRRDGVLRALAQAVIQDPAQPYVLVVNGAKKVERRNVQTGIQGQDEIEIKSGLAKGDLVIVSGQTNYQIGESVRPEVAAGSAGTKESE
jgi:RND family efflux transporter MFP subunit